MTVEENIENGSETIEEGANSNEPETKTDYSEENAASETTSQDENNDDVSDSEEKQQNENEFYVATFKDREAAEKGFKDTQAKLTQQANEIKELKAKISKSETQQVPDVNREIQAARQNLFNEYNKQIQGLGYKYGSFVPADAQINNVNDIVQYLPSVEASEFTREFMTIQNEFNGKMQSKIGEIQQSANAKFEEIKAQDKEKYKDDPTVFEAWYNSPETIEDVAELIAKVRKQAVDDYIKKQAAEQEDQNHKSKLEGNSSNSRSFGKEHIFTRSEIDRMDMKTFAKNEAEISRQVAAGLVQ